MDVCISLSEKLAFRAFPSIPTFYPIFLVSSIFFLAFYPSLLFAPIKFSGNKSTDYFPRSQFAHWEFNYIFLFNCAFLLSAPK